MEYMHAHMCVWMWMQAYMHAHMWRSDVDVLFPEMSSALRQALTVGAGLGLLVSASCMFGSQGRLLHPHCWMHYVSCLLGKPFAC